MAARETTPPVRPAAVPRIDFLPQRFREEREERVSYGWRFVVVAVFALVVGSVSQQQRRGRAALDAALILARHRQASASEQSLRVKRLELELASRRTRAELLTALREPWSRTRVLAGIVGALGPEVVLTELELLRQERPRETTPDETAAQGVLPGTENASPEPPGDETARDQVRDEQAHAQLLARFAGTSANLSALHHTIRRLAARREFVSPRIVSVDRTESHTGHQHEGASTAAEPDRVRFLVEVEVRGPAEAGTSDAPAASVAARTREAQP